MSPESAHISGERFKSTPNNEWGQCVDRGDADFVSTADGKGKAMPFQARRVVGLQNNIGRGIIRVVIHGIRTGQALRRRETNIVRVDINDGERQSSSPFA